MATNLERPAYARKVAGSDGDYADDLQAMFQGILSLEDLEELLSGGVAGSVVPLVSNATISSAGDEFTLYSSFTTTYPMYYLHIRGLLVSATSKPMGVFVGTDEGATDYSFVQWKNSNGSFTSDYSVGDTNITMMDLAGTSSANGEEMTIWMHVHDPANASFQTTVEWRAFWHTSGTTVYFYEGMGSRRADQADTTLKLIVDPGGSTTFSSGSYTLYGVKQ